MNWALTFLSSRFEIIVGQCTLQLLRILLFINSCTFIANYQILSNKLLTILKINKFNRKNILCFVWQVCKNNKHVIEWRVEGRI